VLLAAILNLADGFTLISLLPKLIGVYKQLLSELEPVLNLNSAASFEKKYAHAYGKLALIAPHIMLTTNFGCLNSNLVYVAKLPITGLHRVLNRAPAQFREFLAAVKPTNLVLDLGVASGCNMWKNESAGDQAWAEGRCRARE
jgi:5-methyltetrahydropteroyltriglutamate--homocysteine methyltransferase